MTPPGERREALLGWSSARPRARRAGREWSPPAPPPPPPPVPPPQAGLQETHRVTALVSRFKGLVQLISRSSRSNTRGKTPTDLLWSSSGYFGSLLVNGSFIGTLWLLCSVLHNRKLSAVSCSAQLTSSNAFNPSVSSRVEELDPDTFTSEVQIWLLM